VGGAVVVKFVEVVMVARVDMVVRVVTTMSIVVFVKVGER
jgi:hypothetical protein